MALASGSRIAHVLDLVRRFLYDDTYERSNMGNALQDEPSTVNKRALVVTNKLRKGLDVVNHIVASVLERVSTKYRSRSWELCAHARDCKKIKHEHNATMEISKEAKFKVSLFNSNTATRHEDVIFLGANDKRYSLKGKGKYRTWLPDAITRVCFGDQSPLVTDDVEKERSSGPLALSNSVTIAMYVSDLCVNAMFLFSCSTCLCTC